MKKYILLLISILLFSILISCSKENDINNKEHTEIKEKKLLFTVLIVEKKQKKYMIFAHSVVKRELGLRQRLMKMI